MQRLADRSGIEGKSVLVLGGDGFCGWPAALRFSALGADVAIVDNGSRRAIDDILGTRSATSIANLSDRIAGWADLTGRQIGNFEIDLATDYVSLLKVLREVRPDIIVHFAEQRSAPYSMMSTEGARYSVDNNVRTTHNVLAALVESEAGSHLLHLGTIGVYGYATAGLKLPEGYLRVIASDDDGRMLEKEILYPGAPDSVYHLTKVLDQQLCAYYARTGQLRITDLHQGIVWGTQTSETRQSEALINRFDCDEIYGTVVNRFLTQAQEGRPLTVYGSGSQTRAFIHIEDMLTSICLSARTPPQRGDRVRILNQFTETSSVNALARRVSSLSGSEIRHLDNPRLEPECNEFDPDRSTLSGYGFQPRRLDTHLHLEFADVKATLHCRSPHVAETKSQSA